MSFGDYSCWITVESTRWDFACYRNKYGSGALENMRSKTKICLPFSVTHMWCLLVKFIPANIGPSLITIGPVLGAFFFYSTTQESSFSNFMIFLFLKSITAEQHTFSKAYNSNCSGQYILHMYYVFHIPENSLMPSQSLPLQR